MKKLTILALFIILPFFHLNSQWIIQNVSGTNALMAVKFINPLTGWVAGANASLYKTINGGINWTQQTSGIPASGMYNSLSIVNNNYGWAIGAYQTTGMTGYIFRTSNGGNSWTQQMTAVNHIFYTSFAFDTSTCWVGGTYTGTTGAIVKTTNGGTNWVTQLSGQYTPIKSIFFLNYLTGWAVGNNTMLKTTNSGASWGPITISGNFSSVYFLDLNTGYAGTLDGMLVKTTNGGITWLPNIDANSPITSVYFLNPTIGLFASSYNVFKTTNSGTSWAPMETGVSNFLLALNCLSVNNYYATSEDGNIVYTTNGGGNYSTNTITFRRNNVNKPIIMNGITYDTIMANIPRSTNSLALDINVSIDTVINTVDSNLIFILSHNGIDDTIIYRVGGSGNNFLKTILNDSASIPINNGTPPFSGSYRPSRPLSQFNYTPPDGLWILRIKESQSSERTGVIKSWGITVTYNTPISVKKISEIVPAAFELKQNYPNPFNPTTNIKYQIINNKLVILKIFDILGKEVTTLVNEKQSPGEYEVTFDGSRLSSGIYFYKLQSGDFQVTKKMILIK